MSCEIERIPSSLEVRASEGSSQSQESPKKDAFNAWEEKIRQQGKLQTERAQQVRETSSEWEDQLRQTLRAPSSDERDEFIRQWSNTVHQQMCQCENQRRLHDMENAKWEYHLRDNGIFKPQLYQPEIYNPLPSPPPPIPQEPPCTRDYYRPRVYYPCFNKPGDGAKDEFGNRLAQAKAKGGHLRDHGDRVRDSMEAHSTEMKNMGTLIRKKLNESENPMRTMFQHLMEKGDSIREKMTQRALDVPPLPELRQDSVTKQWLTKEGQTPNRSEVSVETSVDEDGTQCQSVRSTFYNHSAGTTTTTSTSSNGTPILAPAETPKEEGETKEPELQN